jgi:hypothetical protein
VTDPFGTRAIRDRVLAAWAASPARFREDANAEEDAAASPYLVAELAQNAADAAARAGVPGALLLEVVDGTLYAANAGAPLDAAGVEALCHLRASAKSSGVGRYGVGFKAVLAVTDAPEVHSRSGSVAWSRDRTAAEVTAIPALAEEVARRNGAVPVMRLPYDAAPDAHAAALLDDWDTVVVLPLRGPFELGEVDDTLLLTLALDSVTVHGTTYRRDPAWVVHTASGDLPPDLLAGRPVEERERGTWAVTVAARTRDGVPEPWLGDRRLRAPQPADERVDVPVFLSVSVPLEPSRRHVVSGPLTDWLVGRAAEAYVALLESLPATPALLSLLPASLPAGTIDLALREALAPLLPRARLFANPDGVRLRAEEAAILDAGPASDALTTLLGLPQLVDPSWLGRRRALLTSIGVRVLDTADVVDLLHGLDREPSWWAEVYAALAGVPDRDALRALPVPLADGRTVTGPPGLLLPADPDLVAASEPLGLRWVHPDAVTGRAADTLLAAGAQHAEPGALLDSLRDAVEASLDDDPLVPPDDLYPVVLRLLAAEPSAATDRGWLASLALPSTDGDLRAAEELLLPEAYGGRLARWVRDDSPFGVLADDVAATYGAAALEAAGVVRTFDLKGDDLDWVRDDAWPEALAELPALDDATLDRLRNDVLLPATDGTLRRPHELAADDADPLLAPLYATLAPLPDSARSVVARLGLVTTVEAMDDDALADLADRLAAADVTLRQVRHLHAALARTGAALSPARVRTSDLSVVAAEDAYVVDRPDLLPLLGDRPWVPVDVALARALADVLDLRLATSLPYDVTSERTRTDRLANLAPGMPDTSVDVHQDLTVDGTRVAWFAAGTPAVDGTPYGVARLAAWLSGDWRARHAIEAALRGDARDADESLLDPL